MRRVISWICVWAISIGLAHAAGAAEPIEGGYAVVVSRATAEKTDWKPVVDALVDKYGAKVLRYEQSIEELHAELSRLHPRYTCFVTEHAEVTREFVAQVHRLTRSLDEDVYSDTQWGILTGYDAANALAIARHSESLVVRKVGSGTELAMDRVVEGVWYCELVKNRMVRKEPGSEPAEGKGPDDTTASLAKLLTDYQADLFVTSGHATERNWQIGYRYNNGYFISRDGQLLGKDTGNQTFEIHSTNPKVYLPIGNCLMGHIDGKDAMALAWMNSAGVKQMIGYTVPTWYGYAGWGLLDYFVEQPGRYTMAEAFWVNQQAMLHRLHTYFPKTAAIEIEPGQRVRIADTELSAEARAEGLRLNDASGLHFDRDVVAFYGDPAWSARMAEGKRSYEQTLTEADGVFTLTITPNDGEKSFEPVNTNGAQRGWRPIVAILPHRIGNATIIKGGELNPIVADDFILVPNPRKCDPKQPITIVFRAEVLN